MYVFRNRDVPKDIPIFRYTKSPFPYSCLLYTSVEGDQGGTAGLGAVDAFDAGVELRHRRQFAGDQAGELLAVLAVVVVVLPRLPDGGDLVEVCLLYTSRCV